MNEESYAAAQLIEALNLQPLEGEGGYFRQTYLDAHSSAIYYLLTPQGFSALHRLAGPEVYHWYAGAPARLVTLPAASGHCVPDAVPRAVSVTVGGAVLAGQLPQAVVPAGVWQGSRTLGGWTLLGTTMAPPYDPAGFELANRAQLAAAFPADTGEITGLTRP